MSPGSPERRDPLGGGGVVVLLLLVGLAVVGGCVENTLINRRRSISRFSRSGRRREHINKEEA
jgi:hypothetical protein